MGSCIGSCAGGCLCGCCGSCCNSLNKGKSGPAARVPYMIVMFVFTVLSVCLRYWGGPLLVHILAWHVKLCGDECMGFGAAYRISFVLFVFFFIHFLFMLGSGDSCHRGGWGWKISGLFVLIGLTFVIPNSFFDIYALVARFVSGLFLLVQIIILIDFAYTWHESWIEKEWTKQILGVSTLMYGGSLTMLILCFKWFGGDGCHTEQFLISFTLILTLGFTVLSATEWCEHGAILPSAVVTLYAYYLLYSGLNSDPNSCNTLQSDSVVNLIIGIVLAAFSVTWAGWSVSSTGTIFGTEEEEDRNVPLVGGADSEKGDESKGVDTSRSDDDDEEMPEMSEAVRSSNKKFHFIMAVTSMFLAMLVTDWGSNTDSSSVAFDLNSETMWIRIVTQWVTILLYIWTLVAPYLLSGRDFS